MHNKSTNKDSLSSEITLIDTHCHLDMQAYDSDLDQVLEQAAHAGIHKIITIGIDLASSKAAVNLAATYPQIYATIGVHPHEADKVTPTTLHELSHLAKAPKVVGYGEIGLDYAKNYAPHEVQRKVFAMQLELAKKLNLPVVIHDREAHDETIQLLREIGPFPKRGVMHCFSGDVSLARQVIDLGFYISIPGIVTFKNAKELQEVVQVTDIQHLILETDGPFLAPVPFRGKRNTPAKIIHTAQMVADLKSMSLHDVAAMTTRNAIDLFRLPG
jgi:TatD DNase family protein